MTRQPQMEESSDKVTSSQAVSQQSQRSSERPKKLAIDFLLNSNNSNNIESQNISQNFTHPAKDAELETTFMSFLENIRTPNPLTNSSVLTHAYNITQEHTQRTSNLDLLPSCHDNSPAILHTITPSQPAFNYTHTFIQPSTSVYPSNSSIQHTFYSPSDNHQLTKIPPRNNSAPSIGENNFEPVSKKQRTSWFDLFAQVAHVFQGSFTFSTYNFREPVSQKCSQTTCISKQPKRERISQQHSPS